MLLWYMLLWRGCNNNKEDANVYVQMYKKLHWVKVSSEIELETAGPDRQQEVLEVNLALAIRLV